MKNLLLIPISLALVSANQIPSEVSTEELADSDMSKNKLKSFFITCD